MRNGLPVEVNDFNVSSKLSIDNGTITAGPFHEGNELIDSNLLEIKKIKMHGDCIGGRQCFG